MRKVLSAILCALLSAPVYAQTPATVAAIRAELEVLKSRIESLERLLASAETRPSPSTPANDNRAASNPSPALNTPPRLPPSLPSAFEKAPPRFDILMQTRGDFFVTGERQDTFLLRKAELGVKGHISDNVDFSLEIDPVRPGDPLRRTYIRLTHLDWLHVKLGMEKAPIGLEELTSTAQIPFVDRSEVSDRFASAEEIGAHFETRLPNWLFQFAVTNGGRRLLRDDNDTKDVTTRIVWGGLPWLSLGSAVAYGKRGSQGMAFNRYNAELKVGSNLTGMQTEFFRVNQSNAWSSAYYASAYVAVPLDRPWITHFQPAIRYERIHAAVPSSELHLFTLGMNLLLDEHRSKLQVNYVRDLITPRLNSALRTQYQIEF